MPASTGNTPALVNALEEIQILVEETYIICNAYAQATEATRALEAAANSGKEFLTYWELDEVHQTYVQCVDRYERISHLIGEARYGPKHAVTLEEQQYVISMEHSRIKAGLTIEDTYGLTVNQLREMSYDVRKQDAT